MPTVKFVKQWRGHAEGAVVKLTKDRASELTRLGFCVDVAKAAAKKPRRPRKPAGKNVSN